MKPWYRSWETWLLAGLVAATAGLYFWWAGQPRHQWVRTDPAGYYPMLTDAFLAGQVHFKIEPNPALRRLSDPYDPAQFGSYQVTDLSYYRHRYYFYFGCAPVLCLLLPWAALTGTHFTEHFTVVFFTLGSFGLSLLLLAAVRRRLSPTAPAWTILLAGSVFALGNLPLFLLRYPNYWQIPMACAWFWQIAALGAAWAALHSRRQAVSWLVVASLACGLSVAARPSYLLGTLLLLPVAWRLARQRWTAGRLSAMRAVLAAAVLPLGAVGAGLMLYNYLRFDSPFEFGMRYQHYGVDLRHQALISPRFLWPNVAAFLFFVPRFVRYFPFIFDPTETTPLGVLVLLPFVWLAALLPFSLRQRRDSAEGTLRTFAAASAIAAFGNFLLLCSYYLTWGRHEIDFIFPLTWLASLGLLAGGHYWSSSLWKLRTLALVAAALAGVNIGVSFFVGARAFQSPAKLAPVARLLNRLIYAVEKLHGTEFGPVQLQVAFPQGRAGQIEPLFCTGTTQFDLLYVKYLDDHRVQLGVFHTGLGGPVSDPIEISPGQPHTLDLAFGGLCPTAEHPVFSGWNEAQVIRARTRMEVKLDGRTVLAQCFLFHSSTPADALVGSSREPGVIASARFSGKILRQRQAALTRPNVDVPHAADGGVALTLDLPPVFPVGRAEPLLSSGQTEKSDLLFVQYLAADKIRLGLDHFTAGAFYAGPLPVRPGSRHRLALWMEPLRPSAGKLSPAAPTRFLALWDDHTILWAREHTFFPSSPEWTFFGINPIRASSVEPMFGGRLVSACPAEPGFVSGKETTLPASPLRLLLYFPDQAAGRSEPLLVTGVTGRGDLVYVRYLDEKRVRFEFDHWGVGGLTGEPVEIDYRAPHWVEIRLGSLYPEALAADPAKAALLHTLEVKLDGRVVLAGNSPFHRATPDKIYLGENPIGGSTCTQAFTGQLWLAKKNNPTDR